MQFDQVLVARALQAVVDPLGQAVFEIGDDEADVEAERRRSTRATARRSRFLDFGLWHVSA
jgi:hypothetical protein